MPTPPEYEIRPYTVIRDYREFGRNRILIECPFCQEQVWAYSWSLAGSGKKCPKCGAKHTWFTGTHRRKSNDK